MKDTSQNLKAQLTEVVRHVKELEEKANAALYTLRDEIQYRELMRQKAMLLAGMAEQCQPALATMPSSSATIAIAKRLQRFSHNAEMALQLNSVFYMSALLYPDDYVSGTHNDLENFIQEFL